MKDDRKLALKKKANDILANLNISTITDEVKTITFLQKLKQREIEDNEEEILEKTLNNIEIYLHTKKMMQIETDDYNYLKEIAEILRKQNVRIKDGILYGEPVFEIKLDDGDVYYFITREGAKKFAETHSTMIERKNENDEDIIKDERRKDNLMDVTINKNLEIGRIIEIIKRNY